jgi:Fe-S cluster assembly ATP-binding protein
MTDSPLLRVENLSLNRNGKQILNDVDLAVYPGQVHALLGLNGSGKSSLAYALMGCTGYQPDVGRILFDGQDITHMPIHQRAQLGLTLAWQEPARFEGLPVGKYISLGMEELDRDWALAALEAVALPPRTYAVRPVNDTLSGGERKRVELAAVYAMRPRLAILDEPDWAALCCSSPTVTKWRTRPMLLRLCAWETSYSAAIRPRPRGTTGAVANHTWPNWEPNPGTIRGLKCRPHWPAPKSERVMTQIQQADEWIRIEMMER